MIKSFKLSAPAVSWIAVWGITATASAQCFPLWSNNTSPGPSARSIHAMTFEEHTGRVILFGGNNDITHEISADTWAWSNNVWSLAATTGPAARYGHAMCYDIGRQVVVMFGGFDGQNRGDTWEWNGTAWNLRSNTGPAPRSYVSMAYDAARGRTVLYGGYGASNFGDTHEWDGTSWTLRSTSGVSPRRGAILIYDEVREEVVCFGGRDDGGVRQDLHAWDGDSGTWSLRAASGPPARSYACGAFDAAMGKVCIFGGQTTGLDFEDLWAWDGTSWQQQTTPGPSARNAAAMAFDRPRGRSVLFGGKIRGSSASNAESWLLTALPVVQAGPVADSTCPSVPVQFTVSATGSGPHSYQWQIESPAGAGVWLTLSEAATNLPCGGTAEATPDSSAATNITIEPCPGIPQYAIRSVVSNTCGSANTPPVLLTIAIRGDMNCDCRINGLDVSAFVQAMLDPVAYAASHPNCPLSHGDYTGDNIVNQSDVAGFVSCTLLGFCP